MHQNFLEFQEAMYYLHTTVLFWRHITETVLCWVNPRATPEPICSFLRAVYTTSKSFGCWLASLKSQGASIHNGQTPLLCHSASKRDKCSFALVVVSPLVRCGWWWYTGKTQAALPQCYCYTQATCKSSLPNRSNVLMHFKVLTHAHFMLIFDACASSRY